MASWRSEFEIHSWWRRKTSELCQALLKRQNKCPIWGWSCLGINWEDKTIVVSSVEYFFNWRKGRKCTPKDRDGDNWQNKNNYSMNDLVSPYPKTRIWNIFKIAILLIFFLLIMWSLSFMDNNTMSQYTNFVTFFFIARAFQGIYVKEVALHLALCLTHPHWTLNTDSWTLGPCCLFLHFLVWNLRLVSQHQRHALGYSAMSALSDHRKTIKENQLTDTQTDGCGTTSVRKFDISTKKTRR